MYRHSHIEKAKDYLEGLFHEGKHNIERMNERILGEDNRIIKRMFSVDSLAYGGDGPLDRKTRELLGLVASLVLRCDDCVRACAATLSLDIEPRWATL